MVVLSKVISFKNVNLKFGGVQALKDVSFDIEENSLFAIIGPNGAGKTSILNCINGIYKSTSGSIDIFDKDIINLQPDEIANMALKISSHGYIMETGNVVMDNSSEKLMNDKDVQEFYLGLNTEGTERKSFKDVKHYKRKKRWLS